MCHNKSIYIYQAKPISFVTYQIYSAKNIITGYIQIFPPNKRNNCAYTRICPYAQIIIKR